MVEVLCRGLGFQVPYLLCLILIARVTVGQRCHLQNPFDSTFVQASFRDRMSPSVMCHTNYMGLLQQIHTINYKSTNTDASHTSIHLNIDPKGGRTRSKTLLFILNSAISVQWEVEMTSAENLDISLFRFVIGGSSTLEFGSQSRRYEVLTNYSLPIDDQELLTWVRQTFGNLTSFSGVYDVDEIIINTNTEESYPNTCNLNSEMSSIVAYEIEDQPILGCTPNVYDTANQRQVHVIELFSPKKNIEDDSREKVWVNIQRGLDSEQGQRNTLLVLISLSPTLWEVSSNLLPGMLEIVSNTHVDASNVEFEDYSMRIRRDIVAVQKGLLTWVKEEYGPVVSYSNVRVANQFNIYLAAPTVEAPQPTTRSPLGNINPNQILPINFNTTDLSLNSTIECYDSWIQVVVPIYLVVQYGLTPGMVSWTDRSCTADLTEEGLVLKAGLQECGSQIDLISDATVVSNQVIFYESDITEGSGTVSSDDEEFPNVEELDRKYVLCEYSIDNFPETLEPRKINDHASVGLDLYTDDTFLLRHRTEPYRVEVGVPVYLEMMVQEDPTLEIVLDECWIGIGAAVKYYEAMHHITENGCPVDSSFHYLPILANQPVRNEPSPGTIKRFMFLVPDLNPKIMTFFLFCNLSVCSNSGPLSNKRIVECSSLPNEDTPCSEWKNRHLWPVKNVQIGPFRITSRETNPPYNISDKSTDNCKNFPNSMSKHVLSLIIIFSFLLGILLVSTIWGITKCTRLPSSTSAETPPANSPMGNNGPVPNGHVPNGHVPNGQVPNGPERMPFLPPSNDVNPNNIPLHGLYNGIENQQV